MRMEERENIVVADVEVSTAKKQGPVGRSGETKISGLRYPVERLPGAWWLEWRALLY